MNVFLFWSSSGYSSNLSLLVELQEPVKPELSVRLQLGRRRRLCEP